MSAWVFGKLPAHGDFVARGMAAAARVALDDWLSTALVAAREHYGATFDDRYDSAPPWRAEGDGVAGAIAASQDAAGRRFPVLLLTDMAAQEPAACEELLHMAIVEGWNVDRLAENGTTPPRCPVVRWWGGAGRELAGDRPHTLLIGMLA